MSESRRLGGLKLWVKRGAVLGIYLLPVAVAVAVAFYYYVGRTREAMTHVGCVMVEPATQSATCERMFQQKSVEERIKSLANKNLQAFLEAEKGKYGPLIEDTKRAVPQAVEFNGGLLVFFTLLPFGMLAVKLATRFRSWDHRVRDFVVTSNRSSFLIKLMLAAIIVWGWIYLLNPRGVAASTVEFWIQDRKVLSDNSQTPLINDLGLLTPLNAAFFGWYLNLLGYFFSRARRGDVRSTGVYSVLLRKYLFTVGLATVLQFVKSEEATVAAFFIGFIPVEAIAILKELGVKTAGAISDPSAALLELPGMTRWEVLRLQEEGVDGVTALTDGRRQDLKESLAVEATVVDQWIDTAALVAVVGVERYQKVKVICLSGPSFVERAEGAGKEEFRQQLKQEAGISNLEEIAELVKRRLPSRYAQADKAAGAGTPPRLAA